MSKSNQSTITASNAAPSSTVVSWSTGCVVVTVLPFWDPAHSCRPDSLLIWLKVRGGQVRKETMTTNPLLRQMCHAEWKMCDCPQGCCCKPGRGIRERKQRCHMWFQCAAELENNLLISPHQRRVLSAKVTEYWLKSTSNRSAWYFKLETDNCVLSLLWQENFHVEPKKSKRSTNFRGR